MTGGAFQFNQKIRQFQHRDKFYGNFRISERDHFTEIPAGEVKWIGLPGKKFGTPNQVFD